MKKGNTAALIAAAVIAASSVISVSADVHFSDIKKYILLGSESFSAEYDFNGNGRADVFDLCRYKQKILQGDTHHEITLPEVPLFDSTGVYSSMTELKKNYPEGTPWTDDNAYK